jgi:hypothetical protein
VRGRAQAIVDAIRVCHVSLVVWRVKIHTVPTAREKDLSPEAIGAISVGESWSLWRRRAIEIKANFRLEFSKLCNDRVWKLETNQFQEIALDSGVSGLLRAYGFPVNMRRPSGKACTVSFGALRWI